MNLLGFLRKQPPHPPQPPRQETSLYALDHALLNIPLPPPSMWMNMGYWKDTTDFPTACASLLDQVLITAGLLGSNGEAIERPANRRLRLLDVGIGCGDQSLRILDYRRKPQDAEKDQDEQPLFDTYTGLTSLPVQASFARSRVAEAQKIKAKDEKRQTRASVFCADAADPGKWDGEIHHSLPTPTPNTSSTREEEGQENEGEEETWLLALDTLYHFLPSRSPLLTYTSTNFDASLMTFDLLLPTPPPSLLTRFLLYILCLVTLTPYSNLLTESQYRSLLIEAGYDAEKIVFRDISQHVFPGISRFMRQREGLLRDYGMKIGGFKWAGRVMGWWGRGVLRGVIVVARR
ncbi:hypothetical protein BJY04DRAFT_219834 [Aspergillus karnatakaensis]|uniref:uncharacterized protein n=1 Tax=Aspergillus karnatakaensis TaxID=1810916 RepID=UPI003CCC9FA3